MFKHNAFLLSITAIDVFVPIDAINFTGPPRHDATNEITSALGGRIEHEHDKPGARIRQRPGQAEREGAR